MTPLIKIFLKFGCHEVTGVVVYAIFNCIDICSYCLGLLYNSVAGSLLCQMIHGLLIFHGRLVQPLLPVCLRLLAVLDKVCRSLPVDHLTCIENAELSKPLSINCLEMNSGSEETTPWEWLVDAERTCALAVGCCLQRVVAGDMTEVTDEERLCSEWTMSQLLSNGLEDLPAELKQDSKLGLSVCQ